MLRVSWLPKVTNGWVFKAGPFFSVARYLDDAAVDTGAAPPDFLYLSHGQGFVHLFEERMSRQVICFIDETESALPPKRQVEHLRILYGIQAQAWAQVVMATHSPILMALPNADVLEVTWHGIARVGFRETQHFKLWQSFTLGPDEFIPKALAAKADSGF